MSYLCILEYLAKVEGVLSSSIVVSISTFLPLRASISRLTGGW
jgi:hypothetical protein